ncbi:Cof-type HAD-IIB family hydrolase [Ornithinibacillus sp. 179-J 7C1 HS]|uniref:Cof-type HAD-IIB family hydrolase n=1 Tax=Ornithinibacillus sp. 179-J 7C1 HS TaxID=3142384 RepID=UPI0039A15C65
MKLIALDLDGTTLNSKNIISKENLDAIQGAQEQGHIVMVLSGRALTEIKPELEKYGLKCHIGANNGASLYVNDSLEQMIVLQPDQVQPIALELDKEYIPFMLSTNKGVLAPSNWDERLDNVFSSPNLSEVSFPNIDLNMAKTFHKQYEISHFDQLDDILQDKSYTVQKIFGIALDLKQRMRLETFLNSIDGINIASTSFYFDIMHHQASKGNALKYMADYLNVPLEDTVAIGDESNDISMFNIAGLSVAMENASDDIKKHSDVVTLSNDNHGVAYAINNYVLHTK